MRNNSDILDMRMDSEYADFIFKGGNIMFMYVLDLLSRKP